VNERGIEVKVGILVLVSLALFGVFVYTLGDFTSAEGITLYADFPTSADLKVGAPVKITGITVGKVKEVQFWGGRFDDENQRHVQVRVVMSVDPEKGLTLHKDARAYITTQGMLGEKYVEIQPGSRSEPHIEEGAILEGVEPLRLEIVARDLSLTLSEVSTLLQENRSLVSEILAGVNDVVKHVDEILMANGEHVTEVLTRLNKSIGRLEGLLTAAEVAMGDGTDLRRTLENLRKMSGVISASIPGTISRVNQTLKSFERVANVYGKLGSTGEQRIQGVLDQLDLILQDTKVVTGNVREGKGALGALLADQEIYDDMKELLADLRRHPWKFIWKE
jgi:phospholipid/cholesterol/gamma-HCH transport system substrate-binding protein